MIPVPQNPEDIKNMTPEELLPLAQQLANGVYGLSPHLCTLTIFAMAMLESKGTVEDHPNALYATAPDELIEALTEAVEYVKANSNLSELLGDEELLQEPQQDDAS